MASLHERIRKSTEEMKNIRHSLQFASQKLDVIRLMKLEEYTEQMSEALEVLLEAKEKGL